jgi:hypothetical protein
MCTLIADTIDVAGAGKGRAGWIPMSEATVGYDHPSFTNAEHAVLIDFTHAARGIDARVAVELDLDSARSLVALLQRTIDAAEEAGV